MFYINNTPVLAECLDILQELKNQLEINGIYKFAQFKVSPKNIQFNCPIHSNGQERKPSCGILTVNDKGVPCGTVHCFACGYTATLPEMISHCFGKDDMGVFGKEWLLKNFLTVSVQDRKTINLNFNRQENVEKQQFITEQELSTYRYYHPYMYERKLTNEIIERFDIGYDGHFKLSKSAHSTQKDLRCITFPVKDKDGNTLFVARRSVDIKLFHYPQDVDKPVYGLYELPKNVEEIIVCESIFNALTCYVYGKVAVALLGLGTEKQYEQLRQLPCRKFITALDGDAAGKNATIKLKEALCKSKIVTTYIIPDGKDINDLSKEEFENLLETF